MPERPTMADVERWWKEVPAGPTSAWDSLRYSHDRLLLLAIRGFEVGAQVSAAERRMVFTDGVRWWSDALSTTRLLTFGHAEDEAQRRYPEPVPEVVEVQIGALVIGRFSDGAIGWRDRNNNVWRLFTSDHKAQLKAFTEKL